MLRKGFFDFTSVQLSFIVDSYQYVWRFRNMEVVAVYIAKHSCPMEAFNKSATCGACKGCTGRRIS